MNLPHRIGDRALQFFALALAINTGLAILDNQQGALHPLESYLLGTLLAWLSAMLGYLYFYYLGEI